MKVKYQPKFGDVLEHPGYVGLYYMLVRWTGGSDGLDWEAVCLADPPRPGTYRLEIGGLMVIGSVDAETWNVLSA